MELIPIQLYTPLYFYVMSLVVLFVFFHTQILKLASRANLNFNNVMGIGSFVFVLFYMGLRPISQVFGDMPVYTKIFNYYKAGNYIRDIKDPVFEFFISSASRIMSPEFFFLICACLYIIPLYIVDKKWFKEYWFYGFLFLIISYSFWAYGVNGLRNGIATSFFLLAISRDKRIWQVLWILLAIGFHKSMLLPCFAFVLTHFYNKPKNLISFWLLCILLSLVGGGYFELFFSTLGFDDERISYLTTEANTEKFSNVGFRWDFLLYSATAIFAGWFYIVRKQFNDKIYFMLFNMYVIVNAFWILVIRANFSNRFAYLSWFMIGLVIIYPLLKQEFLKNQHRTIGYILLIYFAFTFFMNVIL